MNTTLLFPFRNQWVACKMTVRSFRTTTLFFGVCLLLLGLFQTGCDDLRAVDLPENNQTEGAGALYILCEGNFSLNNSKLALYDFGQKKLEKDFFQVKNFRKLGDTGNDLKRYGSKLYLIVNGSSQLEVLDARTGLSLRQIPLLKEGVARQPRAVAFWEDKAYVCSFDGTVIRIDTASLQQEACLQVGRNPDGITVSDGKLYISNSGGLDYNTGLSYDRTVSVVSAQSFTELKRIDVGLNPGCIKADNLGWVYVAVRGNYGDVPGSWVCIDTQSDAVVATYPIEVTNFDVAAGKAYYYCWDEATHENTIGVFNLQTKTVETSHFITDGTQIQTPFGIFADSESGCVYITDAGDFISTGDVLCFDENGKRRYTLSNVGINPNTVLPVSDFQSGQTSGSDTVAAFRNGISHVFDYTPAPGQFVGFYPAYTSGESKEDLRVKAESAIKGNQGGLVSLGRYGGSLTFGFRSAVNNGLGNDFKVFGNAFTNSAEPGIVEVSEDVNGNGLPDDVWYELAGSEYAKPTTVKAYRLVYRKPVTVQDSVTWYDNLGRQGRVGGHYPAWEGDSMACTGTLLPPTAIQNEAGFWQLQNLPWGYADNRSNDSDLSGFDLDWAVDSNGNPVMLNRIHFVRVYTAVHQSIGKLGELSTEVTGALNLYP